MPIHRAPRRCSMRDFAKLTGQPVCGNETAFTQPSIRVPHWRVGCPSG